MTPVSSLTVLRLLSARFWWLILLVVTVSGACASPPEVPLGPDGKPDPVLAEGRDVFADSCKSCHGSDGKGGRGPSLKGVVVRYADIEDQIAVIANGRGGQMPAFGQTLTEAQILAVARYTREVIDSG